MFREILKKFLFFFYIYIVALLKRNLFATCFCYNHFLKTFRNLFRGIRTTTDRGSSSISFPLLHTVWPQYGKHFLCIAVFRSLWGRTSKDRYGRHEYRHVTGIYVGLCKSTSCNLSSRVIARVGDAHMNIASYLNPLLEVHVIITHTFKCKCCPSSNFHFISFCFPLDILTIVTRLCLNTCI